MRKKSQKQPVLTYCKCEYCQTYFTFDKRPRKFCSLSHRSAHSRAKTTGKQPKIRTKKD